MSGIGPTPPIRQLVRTNLTESEKDAVDERQDEVDGGRLADGQEGLSTDDWVKEFPGHGLVQVENFS